MFDKEGAGQHRTREGGVEYKRGDARAFGRLKEMKLGERFDGVSVTEEERGSVAWDFWSLWGVITYKCEL